MKNPDKRRGRVARKLVKLAVWIAFLAAVVWLVMALWNWLMPGLFVGARTIGYWQALGLLALCKILFGGGGHGRWHAHRRWHRMSREEREQFRQRFGGRWGGDCRAPGQQGEQP